MSDEVIVVSQEGRVPLHVVVVGQLDIGRECDGLLLADQRVSRLHLRLELVDGQMVVADLGSSNGTFLDGLRIRAPVVLDQFSTITLGETSIRLRGPDADGSDRHRAVTAASPALGGIPTNHNGAWPAAVTELPEPAAPGSRWPGFGERGTDHAGTGRRDFARPAPG